MAYVSKQDKLDLTPGIKAVLKKYDVKGTISVQHHSTLVVKLKSGAVDFNADNIVTEDIFGEPDTRDYHDNHTINTYHIDRRWKGEAKAFLYELKEAMEGEAFFNHDDSMTDYFFRSHYIDVKVGYNAPYACTAADSIAA
tara:strand:- start:14438 stop:14857 length:420 start_codon:yes stop_codon:yes gene_type:complete